ncbi:MAG: KamA family radical SAM protein [Deltaproteobacteria bacterium]|nr:KamA family radical SAM protein [Deltaproteobacteria bacterium]
MGNEILAIEDCEPPNSRGLASALVRAEEPRSLFPLPDKKSSRLRIQSNRLVPRFCCSPRTVAFRRRFFANATSSEWNDWHWQLQHGIHDCEGLGRIIRLSDDERKAINCITKTPSVSITPYYTSLLDEEDSRHPIRRSVVPVTGEFLHSRGESSDPLEEDHDSPVPGVVHRYPDRVLLLATNFCSTYCRYCTRSRMVGGNHCSAASFSQLERAIAYIESCPEIRDVLISGGDPLTLSDERIEWLLSRLRGIAHVEILRIGTKVPVVLPQRITPALTRVLRRYHPLWMSIHFTHPDELTPEVAEACGRLADAGIPLGSQTVLLKGINDDVGTMKRLMHGLLKIRVKPYYLYQCDPIVGSSHFRTSVAKGFEIIGGLRGHTTGYAVPVYVIDAPGGGGKIPLVPDPVVGHEGDELLLRNFRGEIFRYPDIREEQA